MAHKFTLRISKYSHRPVSLLQEMAEGAIEQAPDEQLIATLDEEMNPSRSSSKHMAGNMRSRWTNFLISDGEKPGPQSRHRICRPTTTAPI